jgi:hypothetical protein
MKINALAFALAALASASARLEVKSKPLAGLNDGDEPTTKLRGGDFALEVNSKLSALNGCGDPSHRAAGRHTSFGAIAKTGTCHLKIGTPEQYPPPSDWKSSCGGVYPWGCQGDCQTEKGMYWKGEKHTCGSWPGWACELQCHYDPPKTSCP